MTDMLERLRGDAGIAWLAGYTRAVAAQWNVTLVELTLTPDGVDTFTLVLTARCERGQKSFGLMFDATPEQVMGVSETVREFLTDWTPHVPD